LRFGLPDRPCFAVILGIACGLLVLGLFAVFSGVASRASLNNSNVAGTPVFVPVPQNSTFVNHGTENPPSAQHQSLSLVGSSGFLAVMSLLIGISVVVASTSTLFVSRRI
jgi:hypothetical protein